MESARQHSHHRKRHLRASRGAGPCARVQCMGHADIRGSDDAIAREAEGPGTGDAHWPMQQPAGGAEQRLGFVSTEAGSFSQWSELWGRSGEHHISCHTVRAWPVPRVSNYLVSSANLNRYNLIAGIYF